MKKFLQILGAVLKVVAKVGAVYAALGAYDVARNKPLDKDVAKRYFTGNGLLTWLLSPLNVLLDLVCLPYKNKGIYQLEDFPEHYQEEIKKVLDTATSSDLVARLEETTKERARTMVFWKWYGENVDSSLDIPEFHDSYKYIQTIGCSVFSKKQSTTKHFGPFRATLRILYNINQMEDDSAYIVVGGTTSYWRTNKLFIFDDTLMHQSVNETEQTRYCMFIDVLRPTPYPAFLAGVVSTVRFWLRGVNFIFYKNWDVVKG